MRRSKILFIIVVTILVLTLFNIKVYAENMNFSLGEESIEVNLNGTKFLSYSGGSGSVTWESNDPSIATVNNGTIEGKKIGTTTITATRGNETASCTVNVVYNSLIIGGNEGKSVSSVNLILGEHDTETLVAKVEDGDFNEVSNATVNWTSSDTSIVTVDNTTGVIKAVKQGKATITASASGVSDTCEIVVYASPTFTDFSNAQYQTSFNWTTETLQITGINPTEDNNTGYYYMITPNNTKPNIEKTNYGAINVTENNSLEYFSVNTDEKYIYTRNISKYAELNQDMYIWIIQETRLGDYYYDTNGNYISHATKFVVEGKKITRAELPQLNLILQKFSIGYWTLSNDSDSYTFINFYFPTETENRKFTIKIGKITDNSILSKIKNNDYSGITDLLDYAKSNNSIYSQSLTTTSTAYFRSDTALFDGNKLLEHKAYYYIYVQFDDENGKYYPVEGVTLGQAWLSSSSESWDLWAYTSSDFQWDKLSSTSNDFTGKSEDNTLAPGKLPQTGVTSVAIVSLISAIALGIFFYKKYNKFKDIN